MDMMILGATALSLGLRHGVDIDHIAAIFDMAGTSSTEKGIGDKPRRLAFLSELKLPLLYVLGHGLMVLMLGLFALSFGAIIPDWVDAVMERVVGVTLLLMSVYLICSLYAFARKGQEFKLRSRWMILFASIANGWGWLTHKLFGHVYQPRPISNWDNKGAFGIGMIHGIGAETGTQVLLFATVAGAGSFTHGLYMLILFAVGMSVSTLGIGAAMAGGLASSRHFKTVVVVLGVLAALFSLVVGVYFALGQGESLPSLF